MFVSKKTKSRVKATQIENKKIIHTLNHTTKPIKEQKTILTIKIITDASFIKDTHQACCGYYILINRLFAKLGWKFNFGLTLLFYVILKLSYSLKRKCHC